MNVRTLFLFVTSLKVAHHVQIQFNQIYVWGKTCLMYVEFANYKLKIQYVFFIFIIISLATIVVRCPVLLSVEFVCICWCYLDDRQPHVLSGGETVQKQHWWCGASWRPAAGITEAVTSTVRVMDHQPQFATHVPGGLQHDHEFLSAFFIWICL